ncbi:MAG: hypothetical protein EZS28_046653, partial [Streblomastix strix]
MAAPHAMGQMTIEPNGDKRNQGIRLMKNKANWDSFVLTSCNADPQDRDDVWKVGQTSSQFSISKQKDEAQDYKGIIIDFDCTALKFNNQIVAPLPVPPTDYVTQQKLALSTGLNHVTGLLDYFGAYITALRGILRNETLNFGFAESYITENRVYP